jgi:hypothetical protein
VKRSLAGISVALVLLVIAALYLVSPLSKSTRSLRVFVERETIAPPAIGYRASVVNQGYLPVFVGACEFVEDNMARGVRLLDTIQRWRSENAVWGTVLDRKGCHAPPEGTVQKKLTPKLLWPGQRLHTSPLFPNIGFPRFPFEHGDKLRFIIFTRTPKQDSEGLSGPEFTID